MTSEKQIRQMRTTAEERMRPAAAAGNFVGYDIAATEVTVLDLVLWDDDGNYEVARKRIPWREAAPGGSSTKTEDAA